MSSAGRADGGPSSIRMTTGLPETVLPDEPEAVLDGLLAAASKQDDERRQAVAAVVRSHPESSAAWAALGALARDDVEGYACFRVGYHRGLDALRRAGWKGSGFVRWEHPSNRGFLRCVDGLGAAARAIGESEEAERCAQFLHQLDPVLQPGLGE